MPKNQNGFSSTDIKEVDITKVFKIISFRRWTIINTTIFMLLLASIFLYFQPSIYEAYTIIKVKDDREFSQKNIMLKPSTFLPVDIKKGITLLKTFYINNQALNLKKVDLEVQYYTFKNNKTAEIFTQIPIRVEKLEILDKSVIGKRLTITPTIDGYNINFRHSFLEKLTSYILGKSLQTIDRQQHFKYNEMVTTRYFRFKINKLSNFDNPIDVMFNGDNRSIYEHIIKNNLKIKQFEADVPLIEISYRDNSQKRAIAYVSSLADSFIAESIKNKSEQSNKVLEFINKELNSMKERLEKSEKSLEKYQVLNDAVKPSLQAKTFIKKLSEIEIELSENRLKSRLAKNLMKFIHNNYSLDAMAPSLMALGEEPTLKLIERLQESQLKRDALLPEFTPKHPKVIAQQRKIDSTRAKIIQNIKNIERYISQNSINLKKLQNSYEKKIKSLPTKERKLINIQRDYAVSSKMYNFLLEKQAENEIIKVSTLSDYNIIDKAYSPNKPVSPNVKMIIIASILVGLVIGTIIAFIRNSFDNKIRDIEDIESSSDLTIYGTLPLIKNRILQLEVYSNPNSSFTESYRALRSNIQLFLGKRDKCKTILLTSTVSGEGKNITSANLSAILQMANYKIVAIDLDMRQPSLDKLFGIKNISAGVSSYLKGECDIYNIIYSTPYSNLNIIPVGERPSNPSELILSERLPKLIEHLKRDYDYIVINSTPFGVITDTIHIMEYSDMNLVLFREDYSKKRYISNLNKIIKEDMLKNMGVVYIQNRDRNIEDF